jgi:hypothetical protein
MKKPARMFALACAASGLALTPEAGAQTQLTAAQYKSVMSSPMIARGDYPKMTSKHKALAACIDWSKSSGDKVQVGPSASYGGDDLAEAKAEAMKNCQGLEKDFNCKCQLVDVDGKPAS